MDSHVKKMGRPTREESTALREALVDHALDMLCERGTAGLTMDALAERSQVTKRTIYHHFTDRNGLISVVVEREVVRLMQTVVPPGPAPADPIAALHAWSRHYLSYTLDPRTRRFGMLLGFESLADPVLAGLLRTWITKAKEPLTALVSKGQADGLLRAGDPRQMVVLLMDLLNGPSWRLQHHYPDDLVMTGMTEEAFFAARWDAFMLLAGPFPKRSGDD